MGPSGPICRPRSCADASSCRRGSAPHGSPECDSSRSGLKRCAWLQPTEDVGEPPLQQSVPAVVSVALPRPPFPKAIDRITGEGCRGEQLSGLALRLQKGDCNGRSPEQDVPGCRSGSATMTVPPLVASGLRARRPGAAAPQSPTTPVPRVVDAGAGPRARECWGSNERPCPTLDDRLLSTADSRRLTSAFKHSLPKS